MQPLHACVNSQLLMQNFTTPLVSHILLLYLKCPLNLQLSVLCSSLQSLLLYLCCTPTTCPHLQLAPSQSFSLGPSIWLCIHTILEKLHLRSQLLSANHDHQLWVSVATILLLNPPPSSTFSLATPATLCYILDAYISLFSQFQTLPSLTCSILIFFSLQTYLFSMPLNSTKFKDPGSSSHCKANSIPKVKPLTASCPAQSYVVIDATLPSHIIND